MTRPPRSSFRRVLAAPAALALVSGGGLAAALVGDGPADQLSALAVAAPLAAIAWALARRRG